MKYTYTPVGVCSRFYEIDIEDDIIKDIKIVGGCNGNLKGIVSLLKGMEVDDAIKRMRGVTCGFRPTSCPDQIARALESTRG